MFLKTMGVLSTIQLRVWGFCPRVFYPWGFCPREFLSVPPFINPFPNKLLILHVSSTSLLTTLREKEKLLVFSTHLENFLPFSSNSKLSSVNSFSLEESEICCLEKG